MSRYSDDYTRSGDVDFFWHETYHRFEQVLGIATTNKMIGDTGSAFWDGSQKSSYKFDPDKAFWDNHFEARASYFAGCMTGGDCSSLESSSLKLSSTKNLEFNNGRFEIAETVTGSRIVHRQPLESDEID
jgi:hypothetical protein